MIKTLIESKKIAISSIRQKLLALGMQEEVEYDSINIEPVLIYSFNDDRRVFLRHKWGTICVVRLSSHEEVNRIRSRLPSNREFELEENDQDGTLWMKFDLPKDEEIALNVLADTLHP